MPPHNTGGRPGVVPSSSTRLPVRSRIPPAPAARSRLLSSALEFHLRSWRHPSLEQSPDRDRFRVRAASLVGKAARPRFDMWCPPRRAFREGEPRQRGSAPGAGCNGPSSRRGSRRRCGASPCGNPNKKSLGNSSDAMRTRAPCGNSGRREHSGRLPSPRAPLRADCGSWYRSSCHWSDSKPTSSAGMPHDQSRSCRRNPLPEARSKWRI